MKWFRDLFGGEGMAALTVGKTAPDFTLETMDGKKFNLREALERGPVVVAFFKVSCPTCQYTFPFLERLYQAYRNQNVMLIGVSQNDKKDTAAFTKQFGITFPVLLDDIHSYPVSNAFGLTNVPTMFWIARDGEIEISSVGWVKSDFEQLNKEMAQQSKAVPAAVFRPGEDVRDFRAG
jgi:peroxiredoxin